MYDKQVVAAILTLTLHTAEHEQPSKQHTEHWRDILKDYKRFFQELENSDHSIDKRGINPD